MAILCMCQMGEFLCSGSTDKSIGIWKREAYVKLSKVGVISGHEGPVKCLQASPGNFGYGFLLYSGSLDSFLSTNFFLIIVHWVILIADFPSLRSPQ